MNTPTSLKAAMCAAAFALGSFASAAANPAASSADDYSHGLLGQTYTGVEFAYTHHVESPPRALHRYGFVSSRPIAELGATTDAAFRYDYTRGSTSGVRQQRHDLAVGFTRYLVNHLTKPFLRADAGYAMQKAGDRTKNSFAYLVGTGVEIALTPWVAVTPHANYRAAPSISSGRWQFGATTAHRFSRAWSGTLTVQMDPKHNVTWAGGVQRRF